MSLTDIDLRITLTTAQRNAWTTIRPILKAYLAKILRLYRRATPEQKAQLLAHNPLLAAIVDALGGDE